MWRRALGSLASTVDPSKVGFWTAIGRSATLVTIGFLMACLGIIALLTIINLVAWPFVGHALLH